MASCSEFDDDDIPLALLIEGKLGDDHQYTTEIRIIANRVVKGDEWPVDDVDLSKVTFWTRTQARSGHGNAIYQSNEKAKVGVSEHTIDNAGWEAAHSVIRHELVHVWQHQHRGKTVEFPDGTVVRDIQTGHKESWKPWEDLMDVSRTSRYYVTPRSDYSYILSCPTCDRWWGKYRLCKTVRQVARGELLCGNCKETLYLTRPEGSTALPHMAWSDEEIKEFVKGGLPRSDQLSVEYFVLSS